MSVSEVGKITFESTSNKPLTPLPAGVEVMRPVDLREVLAELRAIRELLLEMRQEQRAGKHGMRRDTHRKTERIELWRDGEAYGWIEVACDTQAVESALERQRFYLRYQKEQLGIELTYEVRKRIAVNAFSERILFGIGGFYRAQRTGALVTLIPLQFSDDPEGYDAVVSVLEREEVGEALRRAIMSLVDLEYGTYFTLINGYSEEEAASILSQGAEAK